MNFSIGLKRQQTLLNSRLIFTVYKYSEKSLCVIYWVASAHSKSGAFSVFFFFEKKSTNTVVITATACVCTYIKSLTFWDPFMLRSVLTYAAQMSNFDFVKLNSMRTSIPAYFEACVHICTWFKWGSAIANTHAFAIQMHPLLWMALHCIACYSLPMTVLHCANTDWHTHYLGKYVTHLSTNEMLNTTNAYKIFRLFLAAPLVLSGLFVSFILSFDPFISCNHFLGCEESSLCPVCVRVLCTFE